MRRLVAGWLAVSLGACVHGEPERKTYGKRPDAARPENTARGVSFAPLLEQRVISHSVYTEPAERELMKRVLLGPNLVFESSRSSLDEPNTIGPQGGGGPDLKDALGTPIPIELSSVLMNYLSSKGSVMLAPAVTRRFASEWWCTKDWCPKTTWVERLLLLYSRRPDGKDAAVNLSGRELRTEDLPTSAMAVRRLGIHVQRVQVAVAQGANGDLEFRPRQDQSQISVCPADLAVDVPVIAFSAELVSMKDGRILARIDEERSPKVSINARRLVDATVSDPVSDVGYTVYQDGEPYGGKYQYIKAWNTREVLCGSAIAAYQEVSREVVHKLDTQLQPTVTELFKATLDQLYR